MAYRDGRSGRWASLAVVGLLVSAAGCGGGDPYESATAEMLAITGQISDTLETVKDKASAEAAAAELKAVAGKMKALKERMDKLGKPSEAVEKALKEKYEGPLKEAGKRMGAAMMKIMGNPEYGQIIAEAMKDLR